MQFGVAAICFSAFCDRRRALKRSKPQRRLGLRLPCLMQCPMLPDRCCLWRKRRQRTRKSAGWQAVPVAAASVQDGARKQPRSPNRTNRSVDRRRGSAAGARRRPAAANQLRHHGSASRGGRSSRAVAELFIAGAGAGERGPHSVHYLLLVQHRPDTGDGALAVAGDEPLLRRFVGAGL